MKLVSFIILGLVALVTTGCGNRPHKQTTHAEVPNRDSLVKKGEYLVTIMGCGDCHTPKRMGPNGPEPDPDFLFSGHPSHLPLGRIDTGAIRSWILFNHMQTAAVGPWGVSFAANITPDSTGIGTWREQQFFNAMRKGKYKGLDGSRSLLPPMPWPSYSHMVDEDLRAIFYYLKSLKPVRNVVPPPVSPLQIASMQPSR